MDEVEVKVVELKIRKRFFESFERCLVTAASIQTLLVTKMSSRLMPESLIPRPTLRSLR